MNPLPPPPPIRPPFNDLLLQALSPVKQILEDKARLDLIKKKYGAQPLQKQLPPQPLQWQGDNRS